MRKGWVFDSSPLVVLGKIKALELIALLPGRIVVPKAVAEELAAGPASDPARLWIRSRGCPGRKVSVQVASLVAGWDIGAGEAAVITYARAHAGHTAILDDRLARTCATSLRVPMMGTIGLLLWMKRRSMIGAVRPYLDRMAATDFRLDENLILEALRLAGEGGER